MQLLYAGEPGTAHSEAYLRFLADLGETSFLDVTELPSADLSEVDVLVVDADYRHEVPPALTLERLSCPTVLVGNFGVHLGESLHLKLGNNYGCTCLDEDAVVWDASHTVFAGLGDAVVDKRAPANFLSETSRALYDVREVLPTLRVLRDPIETAGQVTTGLAFADSPECEVIAGGFNEKTQEHFAIGRQGRFLQWGFAGSPDDYTPEGRTFLENCLRYIATFRDDPVREFRTTPPRSMLQFYLAMPAWRAETMPAEIRDVMHQTFLTQTFSGEAPAVVTASRPEALAWYAENEPFLRNDGNGWYVDTQAQSLGLPTYDLAFLDACLKAGDAVLWERYTGRTLDGGASAWLEANRDHLYFSDWGGYRWVSTLEPPSPQAPLVEAATPVVMAAVGAARYGDVVKAVFTLQIPAGFHAYAPGSDDGLPLALTPGEGFELAEDLELFPADAHVTGNASGRFAVRGDADELVVDLRVQLCDDLSCLAPQTLELRAPITTGSSS